MELYAEAFEGAGALDKLEAFASVNGANFYGLEPNQHTIKLEKRPWTVPDSVPFGSSVVVPFGAGDRRIAAHSHFELTVVVIMPCPGTTLQWKLA